VIFKLQVGLLIVKGDRWQVLGLREERIQGWTHRGVFSREDIFKQKLDFIKAEMIAKSPPQKETEDRQLDQAVKCPKPPVLGTFMDKD
jgi:hypothetical protein